MVVPTYALCSAFFTQHEVVVVQQVDCANPRTRVGRFGTTATDDVRPLVFVVGCGSLGGGSVGGIVSVGALLVAPTQGIRRSASRLRGKGLVA